MPSLRTIAGALVNDWPRYAWAMARRDWLHVRNRNDVFDEDGRGLHPRWKFSNDLHIAKVFPFTGTALMRAALRQWPIAMRDTPASVSDRPAVTFIIGHRGTSRIAHLLETLRSIAGQRDAAVECIVVEQSDTRDAEPHLPSWVRYVHTPLPRPDLAYCRSWAFNVAALAARGRVLVLHDNDMLVPERYAAEALARVDEGAQFVDLKRFIFYLDERDTERVFATHQPPVSVASTVVQNLQGGSIVAERDAYFAIGGFDETFIGWGGEDNDFWERAQAHGDINGFGYLPIVHLFHAPQPDKLLGNDAPAVKRYYELANVPAGDRIVRLRKRAIGRVEGPSE